MDCTRDGVPHDRCLPDLIVITVIDIDTGQGLPVRNELTVTDENGQELLVVVRGTHDVDQDWVTERKYELDGVRGKRYSTRAGTRVELHSTGAFEVRDIDETHSTRLLIVGDSHVGYRHRPGSEKPDWAQSVDGRRVFTLCLERAREANVDAVVHAGDVFDHHNTRGDRNLVGQEISRTVRSGIPFYYVYGNHDDEQGRRLLESTPGVHLSRDSVSVGEQSVNLLGVDHSGREFPTDAPTASIELVQNRTIVVIHERPHPIVDDAGGIVYRKTGDEANVSHFIDTAAYDIDLLVTGHLHVANRALVQGHDVPMLVTGPTMPISRYEEESRPSTWLVTVTASGFDIERQPLSTDEECGIGGGDAKYHHNRRYSSSLKELSTSTRNGPYPCFVQSTTERARPYHQQRWLVFTASLRKRASKSAIPSKAAQRTRRPAAAPRRPARSCGAAERRVYRRAAATRTADHRIP